MSYCNHIKSEIILNMDITHLEDTLANCEKFCDNYHLCDTACLMLDELKLKNGECLKCPHCEHYQEFCDCPDLFYSDTSNSKEINNQLKLLEEMHTKGFNVVTCGHCGQVFIHKISEVENT